MDSIVLAAMAKWPAVPHCHGWLALDRRGQWILGGEILRHVGLREFINRNYGHDDRGHWFFQNGPQRVYVDLAYTPLVIRIDGQGGMQTHTGLRITGPRRAWLDDEGSLVFDTSHGPALLDDRDLPALLPALRTDSGMPLDEEALWSFAAGDETLTLAWHDVTLSLGRVCRADVPALLGYTPHPQPQSRRGEPDECF